MEVRIVSEEEALAGHVPAWTMLAESALEPNPFYEHWMLLPAVRHYGRGKDLKFVLIFQKDLRPAPLLCGLVPLERIHHFMGLPVSGWSVWKYNHCPFTTPLIRNDCAREVLAAFFQWLLSHETGGHLLEWRYVLGEGMFNQLLIDQLHHLGTVPLVSEWYTRAFFRPMENPDRYLSVALSGKHRKAFKRRADLLAEMGPLEFTVANESIDIGDWIGSFLRIESSGWKGREGSAMACTEPNRRFFSEAVTNAFRANRLLMTALRLGGKTIAQNCYFRAGIGSFHFKPAFDEEYARFSPGFHMECELIHYLHSHPEIEWMDSCTSSGNEMYNRLFIARRTIQDLLIPIRGGARGLLVSAIPCLRYLKKTAKTVFGSNPSPNGRPKTEVPEAVK